MTKQRDPNSGRSKRRAARNFVATRHEKRAKKRLNSALGAYNPNDSSSVQPGSMKYW